MSRNARGVGLFSLRNKLIVFAVALALIPLGIAGRQLTRIVRDELKSAANEEILRAAEQVRDDLDAVCRDGWLAPLRLIADSMTAGRLDSGSIRNLLETAVAEVPDIVACGVRVEDVDRPLTVTRDDFSRRVAAASLAVETVLRPDDALLTDAFSMGSPHHLAEVDAWLLPIVLPLPGLIPERRAWLVAHVRLDRLAERVSGHPFNDSGRVRLLDEHGNEVFDPSKAVPEAILEEAARMSGLGRGTTRILPMTDETGIRFLAGYAATTTFPWLVALTLEEGRAYRAVARMDAALLRLAAVCLGIALLGALVIAIGISRPVEAMAQVAEAVGRGELDTAVAPSRGRDEIALLGRRLNAMIEGLRERDFIRETFGRYVPPEVANRVLADPEALKPGGELRTVTILMSDLRGFTSMSEQLSPVEMMAILNRHLGDMSELVMAHGGTVIEMIGDAVLALFGAPVSGEDDPLHAVACAAAMQIEVHRFNASRPDIPPLRMGIGINTGQVIVGNIGSEKRMKYGVVGDAVNLAARVESFTIGGEVMVSSATRKAVGEAAVFRGPIQVAAKGKKEPLTLFALVSVGASYDLAVPHEHRARVPLQRISVPASFRKIKGKQIGHDTHTGRLTGLRGEDAALETGVPLETYDNLVMRLADEGGRVRADNLYAKVVGHEEDGRVRLVLTSIPECFAKTLKQLEAASSDQAPS